MSDSPAFIYTTLRSVGFSLAASIIGTAIVLAESGGNRQAVGDNGSSFGWWQIHQPAHPDVTQECAFDPVCSSRAAYAISSGGRSWSPWSTFTSGAYRSHLLEAQGASEGAAVTTSGGSTTGACAPSRIDALLSQAEVAFKDPGLSTQLRGAVLDRLFQATSGCALSPAQAQRLLVLSEIAQTQAAGEAKAFDIFGIGIGGLVKRIAIGALGASLIIVGLVMIGADATLTQAASRIGSSIGKAVK